MGLYIMISRLSKVNNPEVIDKFEKAWHVPLRNRNTGLTSTKGNTSNNGRKRQRPFIFLEKIQLLPDPDTGHVRQALSLDF